MKRTAYVATAVAALSLIAADVPGKKAKPELEKLAGVWRSASIPGGEDARDPGLLAKTPRAIVCPPRSM